MLNALRILIKNGSVLLFILLQLLCFYWIVKYNQNQSKIYFYSKQLIASNILDRYNNFKTYIHLKELSDSLAAENAILLTKSFNKIPVYSKDSLTIDSSQSNLFYSSYNVVPARVINNSISKRNNTITLDKGGAAGISPGMGVVTNKGIVGIVIDTSAHFSLVMSVLHSNSRISSRLSRCGFFGSLIWTSRDPSVLNLADIQKYADVKLGDSIVTSGYSIIFPENLLIGFVDAYKVEAGSFTYTINVKLSQPLSSIDRVYIIGNKLKGEKEFLESQSEKYE